MRLHKRRHPLSKHSKTMYKITLSIQILSTLEKLWLEPLPDKTQESAISQSLKKRMRIESFLVDDVRDRDPLVKGKLFNKLL